MATLEEAKTSATKRSESGISQYIFKVEKKDTPINYIVASEEQLKEKNLKKDDPRIVEVIQGKEDLVLVSEPAIVKKTETKKPETKVAKTAPVTPKPEVTLQPTHVICLVKKEDYEWLLDHDLTVSDAISKTKENY